VIRCPTLQVSQFLFPGQRSDTFLTDHVYIYVCVCVCASARMEIFPKPDLNSNQMKNVEIVGKMSITPNIQIKLH